MAHGPDRSIRPWRNDEAVLELVKGYGPIRRYRASLIYVSGIRGDPMPEKLLPLPEARMIYSAGLEAALDEIDRAILVACGDS